SDRPASSSDTSCWLNTASCSCAGRISSRRRRTGSSEMTLRSLSASCRRASASSTASSTQAITPCELSRALMRNSTWLSPVSNVGILAAAALSAIPAVRDQIEVVLVGSRLHVQVGVAPGIQRHLFLEVRPLPTGDSLRRCVERRQSLLAARQTADVEAKLLDRLVERIDLRAGRLDPRFADLREIARRHEARQQPDDYHDDQQLQQRESASCRRICRLLHPTPHVDPAFGGNA